VPVYIQKLVGKSLVRKERPGREEGGREGGREGRRGCTI